MSEQLDILIIGGGFSGVGLAYQAALRGLQVRLVESRSLGAETSANSLRIVHGGFRYLQHAAVRRVRESARAKRDLLKKFPELVAPLACVMPLARFGARSKLPVLCAIQLYRLLTGASSDEIGAIISSGKVGNEVTLLDGNAPYGALSWWDALVLDPQLLIRKIASDAVGFGAEIIEGATVRESRVHAGYVSSIVQSAAGEYEVQSKVVVNAAGKNIGNVRTTGAARPERNLCCGFNLVLNRNLQTTYAVAGQGNGRLLFAVPRGDVTSIGTWYIPAEHPNALDVHSLALDERHVLNAVDDVNAAFPKATLSRSDVRSVETGYLPIRGSQPFAGAESLTNQNLFVSGRYAELLGNKFTTLMTQAEELLLRVAPLLAD